MNGLLYVWIYFHHALVKLRMLLYLLEVSNRPRIGLWQSDSTHQHVRIKGRSDKDGIDAAGKRCGEYVTDLQSNQERKGDNHGREIAVRVVCGRCEDKVKIGQKSARIADE